VAPPDAGAPGSLGMHHHPSSYSETWYSVFVETIPTRVTETEIAFLTRQLPSAHYGDILDVCCGNGRHAIPLARLGYRVVGVDNNAAVIARASRHAPAHATFHLLDMRRLRDLDRTFDGVINLWQSFGYFDDETNALVLRTVAPLLRPGGRLVVDLYNAEAVRALPPREVLERGEAVVQVRREWSGSRFRVELRYRGRTDIDLFEWRIFTVEEWEGLAGSAGLEVLMRCAWFDERILPSADHARMQFVLQKPHRRT